MPRPQPRRLAAPALAALLALASLGALAHPPSADPSHACREVLAPALEHAGVEPPVAVAGTLGYVVAGGSCEAWGSHADACPDALLGTVAVAGALCGPTVATRGFAACFWAMPGYRPFVGLVMGWDHAPADGRIAPAEGPVLGRQGSDAGAAWPMWLVQNPHPHPARVIAYPTAFRGEPIVPGEVHQVGCVALPPGPPVPVPPALVPLPVP